MPRTQVADRFRGFADDAFEFFEQLARHNDREWFQAHKAMYERTCREPMKQRVAELGARPAPATISRINRDLRFSRNTSPYRTYVGRQRRAEH